MFRGIIIAVLLVSCPLPSARAADWPQWHGPSRTNIARETGLLKEWPPDGPPLLWSAEGLGKGYSNVTIAGETIYTTGKFKQETFVIALDLDGKPKWKTSNGGSWEAPKRWRWARGYDGARATPTVDGGTVYHLSEIGRLAAYDAASGKEIWAFNILERFAGKIPRWAIAESVLVDGDRLICYPGGAQGYMVALNKTTGDVVWANEDVGDSASYCSILPIEFGGVRQYVTMTAEALIGIASDTGALLWRHPHTNKRKINPVTPVFADGIVYVTTGYGAGGVAVRLHQDGDGFRAEQLWSSKKQDTKHGGVILIDGHIYGSGDNARGWWCLDLKTGEVKYQSDGVGRGSVTAVNDMLYCLGERGRMALVRATPNEYRIISEFKAPQGGKGLHWAHPVICDGRLYLRHVDKLFCYDLRSR